MAKNENPTYDNALMELQSLVDQLQTEDITIDELTEKIGRAKELITFCREKLRQAEEEVGKILGEG